MQRVLSEALGQEVDALDFLQQGQIGGIYKASVEGQSYVVKTSTQVGKLAIEAKMLNDLHDAKVRVPKVIMAKESLLVLEYIKSVKQDKCTQESEAAKVLSTLHTVTNESRMYGYYYDTTIGPFSQHNEQTQYNWILFLGQMRIMPMARLCYDEGKISKQMLESLEGLCRDLYKRVDMSTIHPSLLHGDVWGGNVLFEGEGACLIDPAIYYGDKEMELAFILLFDTFGDTFFNAYSEVHPLSEDFYESKVPLYQIYPLLVHVALYCGSYVGQLEQILKRLKV
ncbi:MAG: fructosamine kinase family protein [Sulfurovum sp.]|uniref:fructosamine kinase family protein n=1 Tax=Sulfurovum sp. TaxID=1969726 RepID=UPI002867D508|nr:fructosamine kinase family protein [Sulfurovum sp.]MCO4844516.1 fructosamine kinase family protein [Sulfurovum sp.]